MPNATPGGGLSIQVFNRMAGADGTLTLRLLFCVTFWWDAGTFMVSSVTGEETFLVFQSSLVATKCLTRVEMTCLMIIPLIPCMLMT